MPPLADPSSNTTIQGKALENLASSFDWRTQFECARNHHAMGRLDEAMIGYQASLAQRPDIVEAWFNLGLIHLSRNECKAAIDAYLRVLALNPEWPEARFNLAQAYELAGLSECAAEAYEQTLALKSDYYEACYNLGCLHLKARRYDSAVQWLTHATQLRSVCPEAHNNLGQAYEGLIAFESAEKCYTTAYAMAPYMIEACFNLAQRKKANGRLDEAAQLYRQAVARHPGSAAAVNNLGNIYREQERLEEALACFRQVVALEPNLAEGHYNLGSTLRLNESFQEALIHLHKAVQLRPDYADAWNNLALTLKNIGDLDRALKCFNRAVSLNPNLAVARWNRSFVHLLKEDFSAGWSDFEWRFGIPQRKTIYPFRLEGLRWSGQAAPEATILVHDEQGLGDTLQFVRYLPLVKARCRTVVLETRGELLELLQRNQVADRIIVRSSDGRPKTDYDFNIPLMSLPLVLQTSARTIPGDVPYIHAENESIAQWRAKLPASTTKIGLVWSGRPQHGNDRNRSCRLIDFLPLLQIPDIHFVGLQKGAGAEQADALPPGLDFVNYGNDLKNFSHTAAVLANLDLLISVDTAVIHLAGAMGKPAWVMIPFIPDWRWGMYRQDCLWYPTVRLFRQRKPRDWPGVVDQMRHRLVENGPKSESHLLHNNLINRPEDTHT